MRFARYAWAVLAYNVVNVLWGALVRATRSGAGCGNHWPLCDGQISPTFDNWKKVIEFTHRAMTGVDSFAVVLLLLFAFRLYPKGHAVRRGAVLSTIFLFTEALIGAGLVLLGQVAKNATAWSQTLHFANTLTLLACLALTAWWAEGHKPVRLRGRALWTAVACLVSIVLVGITGAISALGDTLFPSTSLAAGMARDFDPASNILLRLRALHPAIAACVAASILIYAIGRATSDKRVRRLGYIVAGAIAAQTAAGVLNLLLLAPVWMQIVHLLLADIVWITLVLLVSEPPTSPAS